MSKSSTKNNTKTFYMATRDVDALPHSENAVFYVSMQQLEQDVYGDLQLDVDEIFHVAVITMTTPTAYTIRSEYKMKKV